MIMFLLNNSMSTYLSTWEVDYSVEWLTLSMNHWQYITFDTEAKMAEAQAHTKNHSTCLP